MKSTELLNEFSPIIFNKLGGCIISLGEATDFERLRTDLDQKDKYELGRTWRGDWEKELKATFENADYLYNISTDRHKGVAFFGLTSVHINIAQVWFLQSKGFYENGIKTWRGKWPIMLSKSTKEIISTILQDSDITVFNFIPTSQVRNIRWLKLTGFDFFTHPIKQTDIVLFGSGKNIKEYARYPKFWDHFLGD